MLLRMNGALHKRPSRDRKRENILSTILLGGFAQKRKSPKRQFGDRSSAFYTIKQRPMQKANPLHGSVGIVQVHSIYGTVQLEGPATNK